MANITYPYETIKEMYETLLMESPVSQIKMLASTPGQQPSISIPPLVSIHPMELRVPRLDEYPDWRKFNKCMNDNVESYF